MKSLKTLIFALTFAFSGWAIAQDNLTNTTKELTTDFELLVSFKNNRVTFECAKGCGFSITFKAHRKVTLNQFGMIDLKVDKDAYKNSDFILTFEVKNGKVYYTSEKGTAWETMSIGKTKHKIDDFGVTSVN